MPKDHGSRRIKHNGDETIVDLNNIRYAVQILISQGVILQIEKTKSGRTDNLNGKKWVTIGPYKTATGSMYKYAVYIENHETLFMNTCNAAEYFVNWVGRDKAREAIREYARNH